MRHVRDERELGFPGAGGCAQECEGAVEDGVAAGTDVGGGGVDGDIGLDADADEFGAVGEAVVPSAEAGGAAAGELEEEGLAGAAAGGFADNSLPRCDWAKTMVASSAAEKVRGLVRRRTSPVKWRVGSEVSRFLRWGCGCFGLMDSLYTLITVQVSHVNRSCRGL